MELVLWWRLKVTQAAEIKQKCDIITCRPVNLQQQYYLISFHCSLMCKTELLLHHKSLCSMLYCLTNSMKPRLTAMTALSWCLFVSLALKRLIIHLQPLVYTLCCCKENNVIKRIQDHCCFLFIVHLYEFSKKDPVSQVTPTLRRQLWVTSSLRAWGLCSHFSATCSCPVWSVWF